MASAGGSPLARLIVPGLIFLGVTGLGTLWWEMGGRAAYGSLFVWLAERIFGLLGFHDVMLGPRERFINLVPFVALMAATPGLSARRRIGGGAAGVVALFIGHLVASFMVGWRFQVLVTFPLTIAVLLDVLPFVLWLYIARDVLAEWLGLSDQEADG